MYASTRNNEKQYSTFEVITGILPDDGGNIVPSSIRSVSKDELTELENCDFTEITAFTLKKFFPDLTSKECLSLAEKAAKSACPAAFTEFSACMPARWAVFSRNVPC